MLAELHLDAWLLDKRGVVLKGSVAAGDPEVLKGTRKVIGAKLQSILPSMMGSTAAPQVDEHTTVLASQGAEAEQPNIVDTARRVSEKVADIIESARNALKATLNEKFEVGMLQFEKISRGDYTEESGNWIEGKSNDDWTDWDELASAYSDNLRKLSGKKLVDNIEIGET